MSNLFPFLLGSVKYIPYLCIEQLKQINMSVTIKKVITKLVHISQINSGDTIIFKDKETTVTKKDIKYCELMGWTIFGDSYNLGYKFVTKVIKWI